MTFTSDISEPFRPRRGERSGERSARLETLTYWGWIEKAIAGLTLLVAAPVILAAGAGVFVLSGCRSPFIAHRRVGRYGVCFWMLKIRTMWPDGRAQRSSGLVERVGVDELPSVKSASDPRVNGRFAMALRRFSVDELPQLIHVLQGRMALVGPRPLLQSELAAHYGDCAREVLSLLPGITGLWQVTGRSALTYSQRRELDLLFVRSRSVRLNVRIVLSTCAVVVSGKNSW